MFGGESESDLTKYGFPGYPSQVIALSFGEGREATRTSLRNAGACENEAIGVSGLELPETPPHAWEVGLSWPRAAQGVACFAISELLDGSRELPPVPLAAMPLA
jgi:hypothetical protein